MQIKIHHIAFTVNNLEESINWYKEKLGFKLIHEYNKNEMRFALLESGDLKIELFNFEDAIKPLPDFQKNLMDDLHTVGTKHFCLEVEDLDQTILNLNEKNVELVTEIDTAAFGGKYIFIKDLNGILIELHSSN